MSDTVLVVEDEKYVLEAMVTVLSMAGFRSLVAQSAAESLTLFQEHHKEIDLIILDWHLPGQTKGSEFLRCVQAIAPEKKVLISTGYDDQVVRQQLGERAASIPILKKPYNTQTFLNVVYDVLGYSEERLLLA